MRKIIILIAFVLFGLVLNAQTKTMDSYNRWAVSADYGIHMVADKSSSSDTKFNSFGGDIRYNVNPKFGIGLSAGTDIVDLTNYLNDVSKLNYARANFETYVNVFNMVDIYSDRFTTLFHGGPGVSFINTNTNYTRTIPNLRGGFTVLYRLTNKMSLKADMSVTGNYAQDKTIDGTHVKANTGVNSMIANASIGLSFSIGKNKRHMDNYVPEVDPFETVKPVINNTYVTNIDSSYVKNYINNHKTIMMIDTVQYVFFDNDKYDIRSSELYAIYKTYVNLVDNSTYTLTIKGLASPSADLSLKVDSENYNMTLSENRAKELNQKFLDMGIPQNRISIKYFGKDKGFPKENTFDVARRVELIITTNIK